MSYWNSVLLLLVALKVAGMGDAGAAERLSSALAEFSENHCLDCHEGEDAKGGLDLTALGFDLTNAETMRKWVLIHDRVSQGEMPPKKKRQPGDAEREAFTSGLSEQLTAAAKRQSDVVLRRLNRSEYQNTVRDLFGIDIQIQGLPEDTSTDGFDNVGEGLAVSAEAMQAYLNAADQVLDAVFGPSKKPRFVRHETSLHQQVDWKGHPLLTKHYGNMFRRTKDGVAIFQSDYCPSSLFTFNSLRVPAGTYRGQIRARAINSDKPVTMRIYGGDTIVNRRERHLVGYFDVPTKWTTIEFEDRLVEPNGTFQPKCYNTEGTRKNADTWKGAGIEIAEIVIEGPLEEWPPPSRKRILGDSGVTTEEHAAIIINRLLPKAFRRPSQSAESEDFLRLFRSASAQGRPFEDALRVSLKAILCSPEFLFFDEPDGQQLAPRALAARLSYFLWSSTPDDQLTRLTERDELAGNLDYQVERMLRDPKAESFAKNFTGQWLNLRDLDFTAPDAALYPEFDELLRLSMAKETELFFQEILNRNLSLMNFIDSDFTFLNGRLAAHYSIPGVKGLEFRRVKLPVDSPRGGLLTQASILKVTANGTYTSPVLRGTWVLDKILGAPTSNPPDNVGSVEPDTRGATTIRELLAKHRELPACATCHDRIDPPGFALECFDPIGGFRTRYRTTSGNGPKPDYKRVPFTWAWPRFRFGPPVDATGTLPTGELFSDVQQFKKLLTKDPDQLTRNLARKLLTYALGRKIGFADRPAVEEIVRQTRDQNYGFRSLVHAIVQSPAFRKP